MLLAQDNLSVFQRIVIQQQIEQTFKNEYYYNPVNKLDYSNISFSDFIVKYSNDKKESYLLQQGSGIRGIEVGASSFKKLTNQRSIWGNVNYQNNTHRDIQWNNNLDINIIGPYVIADSTKNSMKYEAYEFVGGYAKKYDKISIALEMAYQAHLGYKSKDPRPKNISSNIILKAGLGYAFLKNWQVTTYGMYTNYTQNSEISFASETQKVALYQMNGLGAWNRYFSGKSTGANFEQNTLEYAIGMSNKPLNFTIGYSRSSSTMKKFIKNVRLENSEGDAEGNRLEGDAYSFYFIKLFKIGGNHLSFNYHYSKNSKNGTEIYYTDNGTKGLVKLLEKRVYKKEYNNHLIRVMYSIKYAKSQFVVQPSWQYQKTIEALKESNLSQDFVYTYYGTTINYIQELSPLTTIVITPSITYRNVSKANQQLTDSSTQEAIKEWLESDFTHLSSNFLSWGISVKYGIEKIENTPIYIALDFAKTSFQSKKQNNYLGLSIGATF